jgi:hypothetical protein
MEWRPGTAALPGLSGHDAFEIHDTFGTRRIWWVVPPEARLPCAAR